MGVPILQITFILFISLLETKMTNLRDTIILKILFYRLTGEIYDINTPRSIIQFPLHFYIEIQ